MTSLKKYKEIGMVQPLQNNWTTETYQHGLNHVPRAPGKIIQAFDSVDLQASFTSSVNFLPLSQAEHDTPNGQKKAVGDLSDDTHVVICDSLTAKDILDLQSSGKIPTSLVIYACYLSRMPFIGLYNWIMVTNDI